MALVARRARRAGAIRDALRRVGVVSLARALRPHTDLGVVLARGRALIAAAARLRRLGGAW